MSNPPRFDLEKAIAAWRRAYEHDRTFSTEDVEELERHLRDHTADLIRRGREEAEAFEEALRRVGDYGSTETEYRKLFWEKQRHQHTALSEITWRLAMLKNHLTITLRNLKRKPGYTFINVFGLAVGLASCFLIFLFVRDELSYDRFHKKADRIYRVASGDRPLTSAALAPAMEQDFPEVERAVRIIQRYTEVLVTHDGESRYEDRFYFTDPTFFEVFSFPLLKGDPRTALTRPFTIVISEEMAQKHFGDEDPVGQTLNMKGSWGAHDYEITGVARNAPHNSHFKFNFLASYDTRYQLQPNQENINSWWHVGNYTYVLMEEGEDVEALKAKMPEFYLRYEGDRFRNRELPDLTDVYTFQPITDIHLYSHLEHEFEPGGEVRYLYIFSVVALLILVIAGINYTNLATARSAHRAREVGIRKVVGAHRRQLVVQFLGESMVMTLAALVLALVLLELSLPAFNRLTGKPLSSDLRTDGGLWLALLAVAGIVSLLAGGYPALFLSGFQPVRVLKGLVSRGASNALFRNGLVVIQFAVSVALIVGTLTVQRQLDYMQEKRLGLSPEQIVVVPTRNVLGWSYEAFKAELLKHPHIRSVTASYPVLPTTPDFWAGGLYPTHPDGGEEEIYAYDVSVGIDFLQTLDIPLVQGRDFRPGDLDLIESGEFTPVLINETAAKQFGWEDPIGKEFECCHRPTPRVVGVVADFHYMSPKEEIAPLALMPTWWSYFVLVRVGTDDLPRTLDFIDDQWHAFAPGYPFEFTFMDERFAQIYDSEERLAQVFGIFAWLAIVIACLGLFGLAAFTAERRTKEIGIRKVLGATVSSIVALLSKDFLKLVLIAFVVAVPVAWFAMSRWLEDFAYRIEIGPGVFILAGTLALLIALATVSFQSVKAALADPVKSLRYE